MNTNFLISMRDTLLSESMFYIALSVLTYFAGWKLQKKLRSPLCNPLMIATVLCIAFLKLMGLNYADYAKGGNFIQLFLPPSTAVLAISIYRKRTVLLKNIFPVLCAVIAGFAASVVPVWGMCKAFGLDKSLLISLLPKSVTTAIALPLAEGAGGVSAITMFGVLTTGIVGAVFAPLFIRVLGIKNPVIAGLAIGTASHALGTTTALQLGETEGAMSGIAMCIAGIAASVLFLFL